MTDGSTDLFAVFVNGMGHHNSLFFFFSVCVPDLLLLIFVQEEGVNAVVIIALNDLYLRFVTINNGMDVFSMEAFLMKVPVVDMNSFPHT